MSGEAARRPVGIALIALVAVAGTALLLAVADDARADLVIVGKNQESTGYGLVGNDTSGEGNRIELSFDSGSARWIVSDEAGVVDAAAECVALSDTSVSCLAAPFNIVKLETEDGRDVVRAVGDYTAIGPEAELYIDLAVGLGGGRDKFVGGDGENLANGGAGADRLIGGDDLDNLFGGKGADRLTARGGKAGLFGGAGNDRLSSGSGPTGVMLGGRGKDRCLAGRGNHRVGGCERIGRRG